VDLERCAGPPPHCKWQGACYAASNLSEVIEEFEDGCNSLNFVTFRGNRSLVLPPWLYYVPFVDPSGSSAINYSYWKGVLSKFESCENIKIRLHFELICMIKRCLQWPTRKQGRQLRFNILNNQMVSIQFKSFI
jgi:hypothetical protein